MLRMRGDLAPFVVLVAACLTVGVRLAPAQQLDENHSSDLRTETTCPATDVHNEKPSGPEIAIAEVTFSGSLEMPFVDQQQIAGEIQQKTRGETLDDVVEEAAERARGGWQDRGYFNAQVTPEVKTLTSSPVSGRIALRMQVDEGIRYSLRRITFGNNKAIRQAETLRAFFPIKDGDVFSREKVGTGLENLRKAYGELGYINFTAIPNTNSDDANKVMSLDIDVDEGMQFRVEEIILLGLEKSAREEVLRSLPVQRGQIFSSKLWEEWFVKNYSQFPCECPDRTAQRQDNKAGKVTLTLDFRACSAN